MLEQRIILECTSSPSATSSTPPSLLPPPSIIPRPHHPYPYHTNLPMALHTIVDCCCPGRNIRDPRSLSNHPSTTHSAINLVESFTTTDLSVWKLKKDREPSFRFSSPASSCSPSLVASYSLRFAFCLMFTSSSQSLFHIQNLWVIFSIKIWDEKNADRSIDQIILKNTYGYGFGWGLRFFALLFHWALVLGGFGRILELPIIHHLINMFKVELLSRLNILETDWLVV